MTTPGTWSSRVAAMVRSFVSCIGVVAFRDCCSASSEVSRSRPWISPFRRTRHASYDYARLAETQSSTGRFTKWKSGDDDGRRASWARESADAAHRAAGSFVVLGGSLRLVSAGAGNGLGRVRAADSRPRPPSGHGDTDPGRSCPGSTSRRRAQIGRRVAPRRVVRVAGQRDRRPPPQFLAGVRVTACHTSAPVRATSAASWVAR